MSPDPHLNDAALAGYLDGVLDERARREIEAHLVICDACRGEVVATSRAVDSAPGIPRSGRHRWPLAGAVSAAAAAVLLLVARPHAPPSGSLPPGALPSVERSAGDRAAALSIVGPADGAVVAPAALRFMWVGEPSASYRLTVTDEGGGVLWETSTAATSVRLPPTLALPPGARFYWYVDALRSDGSTAPSGLRSFSTASP